MARQRQRQKQKQLQLQWAPTAASAALAAAALPVAFLVNNAAQRLHASSLLAVASLLLALVVLAFKRLLPAQPNIFYGFSLFAFTSVIDLLIPLEIDGFVSNFMDVYLKNGEPYLFSAWGAIAAYWDGTFNLGCYLLMCFYVSNGVPYRRLALLYSSNILNSMVVLLVGAFLSHTGLHWCTLLNVPYVLLPAYVLWTALAQPAQPPAQKSRCAQLPAAALRSLRCAASLLLVAAAAFSCVRGIASLGSRVAVMELYRDSVEPLINQKIPAPFAAVQGIVCLFYFAPAFVIMAVALHSTSIRGWARDLAIVAFGAALQAEVSLLGMEWHPLTQPQHRLGGGTGAGAALAAPNAPAKAKPQNNGTAKQDNNKLKTK